VLLVGLLAGQDALVPLSTVLTQRLQLIGTVLRSRPLEEKISLALGFEREVLPFFEQGTLRPVVGRVEELAHVGRALEQMAANDTFGKTVLVWRA
jgi:NADPH:quinone reductase-like Zn-dependent oxidoreductase